MATVVSVNVGLPRTTTWQGREVTSAIWKQPVDERVPVRGVNLDGDKQADLRVHGGYDKAVYAYALEDYAWWSEQLRSQLEPGTFGENITTEGIDLNQLVVGQRLHIGTTTLEAAQPREPCYKLGMRMGDARFVDLFGIAGRYGAYFRIIEEGDVGAGDEITLDAPPAHGFSLEAFGQVDRNADEATLELVATNPDVPEEWRDWATKQLTRHQGP